MSRKTAFQAMDISLNTFIIFAEIYYVLSKLMLCFYVLKNKAILYLVSCAICHLVYIIAESAHGSINDMPQMGEWEFNMPD